MSVRQMSPLSWLGVALVMTVGLMAIFLAITFSTGAGSYGGDYGMMGGGSWGWTALLMGVPAIFLVVVLVIILEELRAPVATPASPTTTPVEILDARYARSEVTPEEYHRIRAELTAGSRRHE
jgi:uncharacterized membrane protein